MGQRVRKHHQTGRNQVFKILVNPIFGGYWIFIYPWGLEGGGAGIPLVCSLPKNAIYSLNQCALAMEQLTLLLKEATKDPEAVRGMKLSATSARRKLVHGLGHRSPFSGFSGFSGFLEVAENLKKPEKSWQNLTKPELFGQNWCTIWVFKVSKCYFYSILRCYNLSQ